MNTIIANVPGYAGQIVATVLVLGHPLVQAEPELPLVGQLYPTGYA